MVTKKLPNPQHMKHDVDAQIRRIHGLLRFDIDKVAYCLVGERDKWDVAITLQSLIAWMKRVRTWDIPDAARMCLNCGKVAEANQPRGSNICGTPNEQYACTVDMTYPEAMTEIKDLRGALRSAQLEIERLKTEWKTQAENREKWFQEQLNGLGTQAEAVLHAIEGERKHEHDTAKGLRE